MEELRKRVIDILHLEFQGCRVELDIVPRNRLFGAVEWSGFVGMEQTDRQQRLWGILERELRPEELRSISAILTLTPAESTIGQEAD